MKAMKEYIERIANRNTRNSINLVYEKLNEYAENIRKDLNHFNKDDVENFIIENYTGKSETTVANAITSVKRLFGAVGKREMLREVTLLTMKEKVSSKPTRIYTPSEIQERVENLLNYQDKALVMLIYAGLYDANFETIRHLKEHNIYEDYIEANGKKYKINSYIYDILERAKTETTYDRYFADDYFCLRQRNGYLMRGQVAPRTTQEFMSAIALKKRFQNLNTYLEDEDFNPVTIKNSKLVYDMTKLEYDYNNGFDINQLLLIDFAKDTEQKGCIEKLNVAKKKTKDRMLQEIIKQEDVICR